MENTEDGDTYRVPDSTKYSAIGTLIGGFAVLWMVILGLVFPPRVSIMDQAQSVSQYIQTAQQFTTEITLIILLDTVFIIGYISLFVGLWILIRDFSEIMGKIGLGLGLLVGFFDIIENALLLVTVNGLQVGWQPEPELYGYIFLLNTFIDILSYLAAIAYSIIFLAIFKPGDSKFILGCLFSIYWIVGLGSIIWTPLYLVRSLMFIIGLTVGGIILWKEEDIPLEILEKLVNQQQENKGDFV